MIPTVAELREAPKETVLQELFRIREEHADLCSFVRQVLESLPLPPGQNKHGDDIGQALFDGISRLNGITGALQNACEVAFKRNSAAIQHARDSRVPVEVLTKMAAEGQVFRAALQKARTG